MKEWVRLAAGVSLLTACAGARSRDLRLPRDEPDREVGVVPDSDWPPLAGADRSSAAGRSPDEPATGRTAFRADRRGAGSDMDDAVESVRRLPDRDMDAD